MDTYQQRVATIGLAALEPYGFVLAGGYALQAHGLVTRPSDDIDLFTDQRDTDRFTEAVRAATAAWEADGMHVTILRRANTFARVTLRHPSGNEVHVDLAADARRHAPATMSLGPVINETEAVGPRWRPSSAGARPATTSTSPASWPAAATTPPTCCASAQKRKRKK
jgi:hypothetical protein